MKKLALDVGDKTIGVAVSDALNITAQGVTTIERVGIRKDSGKVMDYIREFGCDTVAVSYTHLRAGVLGSSELFGSKGRKRG